MTAPVDVARREDVLGRLELQVSRHLVGLVRGEMQSRSRGPGMDVGDARLYQPGDDARRIDWALSARTNATQVRETEAERELEVWFVVDGSASLDFGTARCEKRDLALAAVGAFALVAARRGNRVGAVCFDGSGTAVVPPGAGRDAAMALMRRVHRRPRGDGGAASLADALRRTRALARRRGLIVVVSDLLDDGDWQRELRALGARHDLVVAEIRDPREDELPPVGVLMLVDPETGRRQEVNTGSAKLRRRFAEVARSRRAANARAVRSCGAGHVVLSTERDWLLDVARFMTARRHLPSPGVGR